MFPELRDRRARFHIGRGLKETHFIWLTFPNTRGSNFMYHERLFSTFKSVISECTENICAKSSFDNFCLATHIDMYLKVLDSNVCISISILINLGYICIDLSRNNNNKRLLPGKRLDVSIESHY